MLQLIKDWWYAYKVCKKYEIKWNPFRGLDNASFSCNADTDVYKIHMSPLFPSFKVVFMHEVGHVVSFKRNYWHDHMTFGMNNELKGYMVESNHRLFMGTLKEEAFASRFSGKCNKGRDVSYLSKAFITYTSYGFRLMDFYGVDSEIKMKYIDTVAKCIRRIEH